MTACEKKHVQIKINPFVAYFPFYNHDNTRKWRFSGVFRVYKTGTLTINGYALYYPIILKQIFFIWNFSSELFNDG